jgi:hypothetical protein
VRVPPRAVSDTTAKKRERLVSIFKMWHQLPRQAFMKPRTVVSLMSENEKTTQAVQESLDRRDNGGETGH